MTLTLTDTYDGRRLLAIQQRGAMTLPHYAIEQLPLMRGRRGAAVLFAQAYRRGKHPVGGAFSGT